MLTNMLDKAIEIEGLLRVIRDGNPLPEAYVLLNNKSAELAEMAERLESENKVVEKPSVPADFVMAVSEEEVKKPKVVFLEPESKVPEISLIKTSEPPVIFSEESLDISAGDLVKTDIDLTEEDDILLTFDDPDEPVRPTGQTPKPIQADMDEEPEEAAPVKPESVIIIEEAPENIETGKPAGTEKEPDKTPTDPGKKDAGANLNPPKASSRQTKLKSAFSLNDRFLYARELFGGNMKMFDSTLDFIEGIDDYSIIEDYFYSEQEWDPENSSVASFMEILRPHFKE